MTSAPSLATLLELDTIDRDIYRSLHLTEGARGTLYGGLVAAQSLRAAANTVDTHWLPHSLHGYFLRPGDSSRPVVFRVARDRDGRSYAARRVVAVQNGEVIFNLSASFHAREEGVDFQAHELPDVERPDTLSGSDHDGPLRGVELRIPSQPRDDLRLPTRMWARSMQPLGDDPRTHLCALTYLSDVFTGLALVPGFGEIEQLTSLDHAVWFYRPVQLDDWVLIDFVPESTAAGRGTYSARVFAADGRLVAGIAQESLFRTRR